MFIPTNLLMSVSMHVLCCGIITICTLSYIEVHII